MLNKATSSTRPANLLLHLAAPQCTHSLTYPYLITMFSRLAFTAAILAVSGLAARVAIRADDTTGKPISVGVSAITCSNAASAHCHVNFHCSSPPTAPRTPPRSLVPPPTAPTFSHCPRTFASSRCTQTTLGWAMRRNR